MSKVMDTEEQNEQNAVQYLPLLQAELDSLDQSFTFTKSLLETEIARVKSGNTAKEPKKFYEVHNMTPVKLSVNIILPIKEYPKFNFVGKLLGPKGNNLKQIQQETQTRMAIQGRGSMRDKKKEEDCRAEGGAKYAHLSEDLHLKIDAFAPAAEAHSRIANAIRTVSPFLSPEANAEMESKGHHMRGRGDAYANDGVSARRIGMMDAPSRGGDGYFGRDTTSVAAPRGPSYDYAAPEPRSRDPYGGPPRALDSYDRPEPRPAVRDSYYDPQSRAPEPSRERYGGDYGQSRQGSWGGQNNGYPVSSGGYQTGSAFGKAPRGGGRGGASERPHPYTRGGGRTGGY